MLNHLSIVSVRPSGVVAHRWGGMGQRAAEVPAPEPDVVPLPPSPHPVPMPPPGPPEIDEPVEPGEHAPVREPPATPPMQRH